MDIVAALDEGSVAVFLMLDLSEAFDTVDHSTLLVRHEETSGITGHALQWFKSLDNTYQSVRICDAISSEQLHKVLCLDRKFTLCKYTRWRYNPASCTCVPGMRGSAYH